MSEQTKPKKYKLTRLGEHAREFGVCTPSEFWANMLRMANRAADQDADWVMLFDERIKGLTVMREVLLREGLDAFTCHDGSEEQG